MPERADDRVLVIAPHPDDESLCCAGLLQQALAARGEHRGGVDHGRRRLRIRCHAGAAHAVARKRRHAAVRGAAAARGPRAADELGVPRAAQYILGYPDRGLLALSGEYYKQPYHLEIHRRQRRAVCGALNPGASYTGANLERDLERVIAEFRPTLVLAAAPQDRIPITAPAARSRAVCSSAAASSAHCATGSCTPRIGRGRAA
jgi:LmbE family N-acetylglucosaminyl deacetylase